MPSYPSFAALKEGERSGVDYAIQVRQGCTPVAVMAIHGGGIEPGTTEIADALAGDRHTFYAFNGLKASGNAALHISSRRFDEPVGVAVAGESRWVVTVHGCKDKNAMTFVGGRHESLKRAAKFALAAAGFPAAEALRLLGVNPQNICNRNQSGMGLQLEISFGMRQRLFTDLSRLQRNRVTPAFSAYILALQTGLNTFCHGDPP